MIFVADSGDSWKVVQNRLLVTESGKRFMCAAGVVYKCIPSYPYSYGHIFRTHWILFDLQNQAGKKPSELQQGRSAGVA
jgi:hypothetical protein